MEDLTLSSVGASFKKWRCGAHTHLPPPLSKKPRPLLHARSFEIIFFKRKTKKFKRNGRSGLLWTY
jgi:hypothetical protein